MTSLHPNKKQKLFSDNIKTNGDDIQLTISSNQINSTKHYFASLFLYDWFLIEIGRLLMTNDDENLLSILCLNREIHARASIVFREHFLNFPLQQEVFKLSKTQDFNQIQQIYERKALALDPDINFYFKNNSETPKCVHDKQVSSYFPQSEECDCSSGQKIVPLAIMGCRLNLDSFAKMILFHPRMNFNQFIFSDVMELFNWSVVRGHLDVVELALKVANKILGHGFSLSSLEWEFAIVAAIIYGRSEILERLLYSEELNESQVKIERTSPCLDLSVKFGAGVDYFALIVNSSFWNTKFSSDVLFLLKRACTYGPEFVQVAVKHILDENQNNSLYMLDDSEIQKIMESLSKASMFNKESAKMALSFAFILGLDNAFKKLFSDLDWSDEELLHLFRKQRANSSNFEDMYSEGQITTHGNQFGILKLILKQLSPNTKISEEDIKHLLNHFIQSSRFECFALIWNDKRFQHSQEFTHQCFLNLFMEPDQNELFIRFLLPHCNLSTPWNFHFDRFNKQEISTNLLNCCWLQSLRKCRKLQPLEKMLEIKWNEELFEWTMMVFEIWPFCESIVWLLKNPNINRDWWSLDQIRWVVRKSCEQAHSGLFESVLDAFPNIDLTENNYRAFLILLDTEKFRDISTIFNHFEARLQFKSESDRVLVSNYIGRYGSGRYKERILKMSCIST